MSLRKLQYHKVFSCCAIRLRYIVSSINKLNDRNYRNMQSARDRLTGELVEAETLWKLEYVDPKGYECWGCGIDMSPNSWKKENKKRPYFSKYPNQSHADYCDADAEEQIVDKGRKESVREQLESAPGLSPSSLLLIEHRDRTDKLLGIDSKKIRLPINSVNQNNESTREPNKQSRRPANTIRPICRAFINFPYDRDMSLNISGVTGNNYMTIFKKLSNGPVQQYEELKIFYSPLQWRKIIPNNDLLIIPLTAGLWIDNKPTQNYQININWSSWSKAKKTILFNELETAQEEARLAKKMGRKDKAWVFFIGEQDKENNEIFYLKDQRLICSIIGDIIYPRLK